MELQAIREAEERDASSLRLRVKGSLQRNVKGGRSSRRKRGRHQEKLKGHANRCALFLVCLNEALLLNIRHVEFDVIVLFFSRAADSARTSASKDTRCGYVVSPLRPGARMRIGADVG